MMFKIFVFIWFIDTIQKNDGMIGKFEIVI